MMAKMIPMTSIFNFLKERVEPFTFLESFAREYSQKVSEDKKTPLFSKTSKYNSFPVRCQWKSSDKRKSSKSHKISKDKITKDNRWRQKSQKSQRSHGSHGSHGFQGSERQTIKPTIFKKEKSLRSSVIKVLNKITEENFDNQVKDLIKVLEESDDSCAVKLIAEIILEKVWYDKSFYSIYVALCQRLWQSGSWMSRSYKVFRSSDSQFFFVINTPDLNGPFKTYQDAETAAKQKVHLRTVFLSLCREHFYKREEYILKSRDMEDGNPKYKMRRKLFGTVEIVGQFYKMGHLDEKVIHFIFLSLLHSDTNVKMGAKYEEEIEAFHLLWNIIKKKILFRSLQEYKNLLRKEKDKKNPSWTSRTLFMIDDMLEFLDSSRRKISYTKIRVKDRYHVKSYKPLSQVSKKLDPPSKETIAQIIDNLTKLSRKLDATKSVMEKVLFLYKNKKPDNVWKLKGKNNQVSKMLVKIATSIIRDSAEYGEYVNSHLRTLLNLLKTQNSHFGFDQLSEAFSIACEDIGDIKIDAPKAPVNMSVLIGNILKECVSTDSVLHISVTPTDNISEEDISEIEKDQIKEWKNIVRLSSSIIPLDILESRINLFSFNGSVL